MGYIGSSVSSASLKEAKDPLKLSAMRKTSNFLWAHLLPKTERRMKKWGIEIDETMKWRLQRKKPYLRLLQLSERLLRAAGPAPKNIDPENPPAVARHFAMLAHNLLIGSEKGDFAYLSSQQLIAMLHRHGYGAMFVLSSDDKLNGAYGHAIQPDGVLTQNGQLIAKFVREARNGFGVEPIAQVEAKVEQEEKKVEEEIKKEQAIDKLKHNDSKDEAGKKIFPDLGAKLENLDTVLNRIKEGLEAEAQQSGKKPLNNKTIDKNEGEGKSQMELVNIHDSGSYKGLEIRSKSKSKSG